MTVFISQPARNLREELGAAARPGNVKKIGGRSVFGLGDMIGDLPAGSVFYLSSAGVWTGSSLFQFDGTKLGIGGTPLYDVDVSKSNAAGGVFASVRNTATGVSAGAYTRWATGTANSQLSMGVVDGNGSPYAQESSGSAIAAKYSDYAIHVWRSQAAVERMRLTSAGYLGIGISPSYKLHVNGASDASAAWFDHTGSKTAAVVIGSSADLSSDTGIYLRTTGTAAIATATGGKITFSPGASERVRMHASGGVSINATADPGAGNLSVTGFIRPGSYTVATVPSASASGAGAIIHVTNESGGATGAESDGTNWRRYADRAIIS